MTAFQAAALSLAARLRAETILLAGLAGLWLVALPFAAHAGVGVAMLAASAAFALAVLALSALLAFDAILFRLMAAHEDEDAAGKAVDTLLDAAGLKPAPARIRTLAERAAGAQRYVRLRRALLASAAICAALALVLRTAP